MTVPLVIAAQGASEMAIFVSGTPPSNPSFVNITSGTTNQATSPATGQVTITAATDQPPVSSAVTYQCLSGTGGWVDCPNPTSITQPAFTLIKNQTNVLGIRARDAARNASPGSLISVTHDDYAPVGPNLNSVLGSSDAIQLGWTPSPSADVVKYKVYYGFAAGIYNGTGAAQGVSPIDVGNVTSYRLSGLATGTPYYVAVEAVDAAGNASGPNGERLVVPNKVNPRLLSALGGSGETNVLIGGAYRSTPSTLWSEPTLFNALGITTTAPAYRGDLDSSVFGTNNSPQFFTASEGINYVISSGGNMGLQAYEMSASSATWKLRSQVALATGGGVSAQPVTDGNFLYLGRDALRLDVYDIRNPTAPSYVALANLSALPTALATARSRVYVARGNKVDVFDSSSMLFLQKGTLDLSAVVSAGTGTITGLAVAGRHLFYTFSNGGLYGVGYALLSAANRDGDTTNGALVNTTVGFRTTLPLREPVVVGDVLYVAENLGLATYDLKPVFFATNAAASSSVPVLLSESTNIDPLRSDPVRMLVDGPFAYLVGGTYRVFDLR